MRATDGTGLRGKGMIGMPVEVFGGIVRGLPTTHQSGQPERFRNERRPPPLSADSRSYPEDDKAVEADEGQEPIDGPGNSVLPVANEVEATAEHLLAPAELAGKVIPPFRDGSGSGPEADLEIADQLGVGGNLVAEPGVNDALGDENA